MAFPQVQSITATVFNSDTTSHAVAMPATVNAGDRLVCLFSNDDTSTVTTPTGWTQLISTDFFAHRLSVYRKTAVGDEGGTTVDFVTSAAQQAAAQIYRITAASDIEVSSNATGNDTSPNSPSFDPVGWATEDALWLAVTVFENDAGVTGYPTNYTNGTRTGSTGGLAGDRVAVASARRQLAISAEDPGAFTISLTARWNAVTIAIRPSIPISKAFSDLGAEGAESYHLTKTKAFSDAGAEGAESFSKSVQVSKSFSDVGAEGSESYQLAKLKSFSDAGAGGAESFAITTKTKSFSDAGAEGSETFSKTRFITPAYLKDRFEAIIIKVMDS